MKTIETTIYTFDELSESAKENAINNYRNKGYDNSFYFDEITESVKSVIELFNLKTGREYSDIRTSHIDDTILQLSGSRLYAYIINNYGSELFKPKYIKTINRELRCKQFICEARKDYEGKPYTQIYSKIKKDNSCTLTGVCYDEDILQPVYNFLNNCTSSTTFEDIISGIESAISNRYSSTEEWVNSEEFIKDEMENNNYEFTEDGNIY